MNRRNRVSIERIQAHSINLPKNPRGPKPKVCDVCQLRKVKCSREQPQCNNCVMADYPCSYNRINSHNKVNIKDNVLRIQPKSILPRPKENNNSLSQVLNIQTKGMQLTHFQSNGNTNKKIPIKKLLVNLILAPQSDATLIMIKQMMRLSIMNNHKTQVSIDEEGTYYYVGNSMAASYMASNSRLLTNKETAFPLPQLPTKELFNLSFPNSQKITNKNQREVIDLYFMFLNSFYPIIHAPSFFYQLDHHNPEDFGFKALLNVICLCGSSFYPDRGQARILDEHYSKLTLQYIKLCYNRPNLNLIQACTLMGYHINSTESDAIISNAWYFEGLAQRMAMMLGYYNLNTKVYTNKYNIINRVLWLISANEVLISHGTGRLKWLGAETFVKYPTIATSNVTTNMVYPNILEVKELSLIDGKNSLLYFRMVSELISLISKLDDMNKAYQLKLNKPNCSFFRTTLQGWDKDPYFKKSKRSVQLNKLETAAIKWYIKLPKFISQDRKYKFIQIPNSQDLLLNALNIYFFSFIIDLNKPKIESNQQLELETKYNLIINNIEIYLEDLSSLNPISKCFISARLIHYITQECNGNLEKVLTPWFWHATLQSILIFLVVLERHIPNNLKLNVQRYLMDSLNTLTIGAKRWALVKDCLLVLQPVINKYLQIKII